MTLLKLFVTTDKRVSVSVELVALLQLFVSRDQGGTVKKLYQYKWEGVSVELVTLQKKWPECESVCRAGDTFEIVCQYRPEDECV